MPYKLISLVFLLFFLIINNAYSESDFILPLKKPSIFKKIEKKKYIYNVKQFTSKKTVIKTKDTRKENSQRRKDY